MSIWYKYFGISEEVLLVLLPSEVPLVLLLSGDLRVLLSKDPDLPLVLLSENSNLSPGSTTRRFLGIFFIFMNS